MMNDPWSVFGLPLKSWCTVASIHYIQYLFCTGLRLALCSPQCLETHCAVTHLPNGVSLPALASFNASRTGQETWPQHSPINLSDLIYSKSRSSETPHLPDPQCHVTAPPQTASDLCLMNESQWINEWLSCCVMNDAGCWLLSLRDLHLLEAKFFFALQWQLQGSAGYCFCSKFKDLE